MSVVESVQVVEIGFVEEGVSPAAWGPVNKHNSLVEEREGTHIR